MHITIRAAEQQLSIIRGLSSHGTVTPGTRQFIFLGPSVRQFSQSFFFNVLSELLISLLSLALTAHQIPRPTDTLTHPPLRLCTKSFRGVFFFFFLHPFKKNGKMNAPAAIVKKFKKSRSHSCGLKTPEILIVPRKKKKEKMFSNPHVLWMCLPGEMDK